jgi:hypothetical protein
MSLPPRTETLAGVCLLVQKHWQEFASSYRNTGRSLPPRTETLAGVCQSHKTFGALNDLALHYFITCSMLISNGPID